MPAVLPNGNVIRLGGERARIAGVNRCMVHVGGRSSALDEGEQVGVELGLVRAGYAM